MMEVTGDLFEVDADAKFLTTNGIVNRAGAAVMGRGVAKQAADRWPRFPYRLAQLLQSPIGNHVGLIDYVDGTPYFAYPVKIHWHDVAADHLIIQSAKEAVYIADLMQYTTLVIPRPGCGNGQRKWRDVKPLIKDILDERFLIIDL